MDRRIFILSAASFATGTEAYVYAGNLAVLAADLHVSVAAAGQLASSFAVTFAILAAPVASLLARIDRKILIVLGLGLLGALNLLAALAPNLPALIGVRICCGIAATLVGPASSAAAVALAPPGQRGRALSIVLAGLTLSFVLGIPLGSVIGDRFGWRATFAFAGLLAFGAMAANAAVLPKIQSGEQPGLRGLFVAVTPGIRDLLALTLLGFAATFAVTAYIGPVVTRITGFTGSGIGMMQSLVGLGSIIGIVAGGRAADRASTGRALAGSFALSVLALAGYLVLMGSTGLPHAVAIAGLGLAIVTGSAALFARTPMIQAALVQAAPQARTIVLALNGSMIFLGQGIGAALGGAVIGLAGLPALGATGALVAAIGCIVALRLP